MVHNLCITHSMSKEDDFQVDTLQMQHHIQRTRSINEVIVDATMKYSNSRPISGQKYRMYLLLNRVLQKKANCTSRCQYSTLSCKCSLIYGTNSFAPHSEIEYILVREPNRPASPCVNECIRHTSLNLNWIVNSNFSQQHSICFLTVCRPFKLLSGCVSFYQFSRIFSVFRVFDHVLSHPSWLRVSSHNVCQSHAIF